MTFKDLHNFVGRKDGGLSAGTIKGWRGGG